MPLEEVSSGATVLLRQYPLTCRFLLKMLYSDLLVRSVLTQQHNRLPYHTTPRKLGMPLEEVSSGATVLLRQYPLTCRFLLEMLYSGLLVRSVLTQQHNRLSYHTTPQAPLHYYGAYPYSPYTPTGPSYTYVTPPGHLNMREYRNVHFRNSGDVSHAGNDTTVSTFSFHSQKGSGRSA